MNCLLLLLSFAAAVLCLTDDQIQQEWIKFQNEYQKTYRSHVEMQKRFAIFSENLDRIERHNELYQKGEKNFSMGMNKFGDLTVKEFTDYYSCITIEYPLKKPRKSYKIKGFIPDVPKSLDWREKGAVTDVKDMGACGACCLFSAIGALEGQVAIKTGNLTSYSEQNLLDCVSEKWNTGCGKCELSTPYNYLKSRKIQTAQDYPYTGKAWNECQYKDNEHNLNPIWDYETIDFHDDKALLETVANVGPVSVILSVDADYFQFYKGGVFSSDELGNSAHAAVIVGYQIDLDKYDTSGYYIIKNSFGTSWGMKGYMKIDSLLDVQGFFPKPYYPILYKN